MHLAKVGRKSFSFASFVLKFLITALICMVLFFYLSKLSDTVLMQSLFTISFVFFVFYLNY